MAAVPFQTVVCPTLVGRTDNLELLNRAVNPARDGKGQTVVFAGEAGIGKTRLVAEKDAHRAAGVLRSPRKLL